MAQLRGTTWSQYDTGTTGFPGNNVTAVHVLGDLVWIGTADSGAGMYEISRNKWTSFHTENSDIPSNSIRDVLIINEDLKRVWLATADGAALYNNGQWQFFEWPSLASNDVLSLGIDTHGNVWVGWMVPVSVRSTAQRGPTST